MSWKGLNGRKKIKDIFIDEKIPKRKRDTWPIVSTDRGEVLWLIGLKKGMSTCSKTNNEELTRIKLTFEKSSRGGENDIQNDIDHVLFSEQTIANKCAEIGEQLTKEYEGKFPLVIGVLKGAMPFMSDIVRQIDTHLEMDFMDVSSYGSGTRSSGEVKIVK